jgi:hypothetical protein
MTGHIAHLWATTSKYGTRCEDDLQDETDVGIPTEQNVSPYHICDVWTPFGFDLGFRGKKVGV